MLSFLYRATKVSRNLIVFPDSKTFEQTFRLTTSSPLIGTSLERSTAFSTNAADEEKSSSSKVLNKSETKKRLICPITRQPARYFDPLTQQPYSSMSAFKVLRQIYKLKLSILHSTDQISDGWFKVRATERKCRLSIPNIDCPSEQSPTLTRRHPRREGALFLGKVVGV